MNTNQLSNNIAQASRAAGAKVMSFMQMFKNLLSQQASPDSTNLPGGIVLDATGGWGGGTAPSISTGHPQIIAAAGGTANQYALLDGGRPKLLLNYSPTLGVQIDGQTATLNAAYGGISAVLNGSAGSLTLTDAGSLSATLTTAVPQLTLTGPSGSAELSAKDAASSTPRLQLSVGTDVIDANIADIAGLGRAQFLQITFCQDGVNYIAKFLMTQPVATS